MKKIKYEKPTSLDAGQVAPILGARCSVGTSPTEGCYTGNNPDIIPYCLTTGATATGACETSGNTAGQTCWQNGATAKWYCGAGSFPG
jgi:hypothetical protein